MLLQFQNSSGRLFTVKAQQITKVTTYNKYTYISIIGACNETVDIPYETVIKAWETALGMHEKPSPMPPK